MEIKHYPIAPPDPIDAIKFRMEQMGMTKADMVKSLWAPLKTGFVMRTSEKGNSKAEGKIFRNRSHSYCEERFSLTTLLFHFVAVRNKK